jgi:hypothetical protein
MSGSDSDRQLPRCFTSHREDLRNQFDLAVDVISYAGHTRVSIFDFSTEHGDRVHNTHVELTDTAMDIAIIKCTLMAYIWGMGGKHPSK